MRGGEDVAVLHRLADPDCDRLLADRDVEEPGQLARPEALLDLLLEVPDQEHLPEKLAQPLLGERSPLALDLCHDPESMLRAVRLVTQWVRIQRQLPEGWTDARLRLTPASEKGLSRAAFLLGPLAPGRAGGELRFHAARGGAGPSRGRGRSARWRGSTRDASAGRSSSWAPTRVEAPAADTAPGSLAEAWDDAVATLPPDWSRHLRARSS